MDVLFELILSLVCRFYTLPERVILETGNAKYVLLRNL